MSLEQSMITLKIGVNRIGVEPGLQVHRLVLEEDVCHNNIGGHTATGCHCQSSAPEEDVCHNNMVGHAQVQQLGAIGSNWRWETKCANSTTPYLRFTALLGIKVAPELSSIPQRLF